MPKQPLLDVLGLKRLFQQHIILEIDLRRREIVYQAEVTLVMFSAIRRTALLSQCRAKETRSSSLGNISSLSQHCSSRFRQFSLHAPPLPPSKPICTSFLFGGPESSVRFTRQSARKDFNRGLPGSHGCRKTLH